MDLVVDDLILGFLQLRDLAELVGLARLAFANHLGGRLERPEKLVFDVRVAVQAARTGLAHDSPHERHHPVQLRTQALQGNLPQDIRGSLDAAVYEPLDLLAAQTACPTASMALVPR